MILSFSYSSTVNAALSAITANTIQGTAPTFKAVSGENRLGFTVNGKFYSESSVDSDTDNTGNIVSGTSKEFNASLKFSDFVITAPTFTVANDYDDSDGDVAKTTGTGAFTVGAMEYEWKDGNGLLIGNTTNTANLSKVIGCGSGIPMPVTLEIKLKSVQVHSEYGDPSDSTLTDLTKVYQIEAESGFCYAKPNQMSTYPNQTWYGWNGTSWSWNSGSSSASASGGNGGGYSSDFDPTWGFKASANPAFPTTGFPGAQFQLVMTGAQTDWTYAVPTNPGNGVTVDSNGNVTLTSKPTGTGEVIVSATSKNLTPQVTHTYKFNPTTNGWFVPKSVGAVTYANAKLACPGGESELPTRAQLTNSPRNSEGQSWIQVANYYTRAIGLGLTNEWGWLDSTRYPSSQWVSSGYWTQDVHTAGSTQFFVGSHHGNVYYYVTSGYGSVACRG